MITCGLTCFFWLLTAQPDETAVRRLTVQPATAPVPALRYLLRVHHEARGDDAQIDLVPDLEDPKDLFALLADVPAARAASGVTA